MKYAGVPLLLVCLCNLDAATADAPFQPHRIADNLYYVGSRDISSYLVTSTEGHAIINSGFEETVPLIRASVQSLGFKMKDVKFILASHAHSDHVEGHALLQELTGAQVFVMKGDAEVIRSGGKGQYLYTTSRWRPCQVDRVLKNGDKLKVGNITLIAHRTAGHTRGCTTWACKVQDGKDKFDAVIVGSPNVNPGYKLVDNKDYPNIAKDYADGFKLLKELKCDLFLGAHGKYYGMHEKFQNREKTKSNLFIDPSGYIEYITERESTFKKKLAAQMAN